MSENTTSPASVPPRSVAWWSAELFPDERGNGSTELFRLRLRRGLREDPHERLRAGGADEHPRFVAEPAIDLLHRRKQRIRERAARRARQVLRDLRVADHRAADGVQRVPRQR